jgi:hypothetical protein
VPYVRFRATALARSGGCQGVPVEFEEVVGGGDQAPICADGGSAASVNWFIPRLNFVAEDGLDHRLALSVKLAAARWLRFCA